MQSCFVFFFKQTTAYEMRISEWSSDVCSSDLRFGLPVVSLVDTSGAFPGVQAEERGQAEAIARSTEQCLAMGVPMIAAVVGEGGSGGAVAIAAAKRVLMFEHAV